MANNKIKTTDLGFDEIKSNLKSFLQQQTALQDYDFEGAALSVILDVLAYNTHYNSLYTNLAVNESFLDSASKRANVVSRAKEIGYIPHSATASSAKITLTVTPTTTNTVSTTLTLPAYQQFIAIIDGIQYSFYNLEAQTAFLDTATNKFIFENIEIYEGNVLSFKYEAMEGIRYIIPNAGVDLATLKVRVADTSTSTARTTFVRQESILNLNGSSTVYFVKEIEGELYELEFGNDIIGKALVPGNIVELTYLVTNKDLGNGIKTFSYAGATLIAGTTQVTTTSVGGSSGGADIEEIESIRYNAPRAYASQNRTVTVDDYRTFIYSNFLDAEAVNVWGGESNVPPQYGRVFVSVKPRNSTILTQAQKDVLLAKLKDKNVVSITPVIVDPNYLNIRVDVSVYYNPRLTSLTENEIKTLVIQTIKDYNNKNLNSFSGVFKHSNLSSLIDSAEPSILSNIMTIKLGVTQVPAYDVSATYNVELGNPIYGSGVPEQSISSTGFYVAGSDEIMYMEDLPLNSTYGLIRQFYNDSNGNKVYVRTFGTAETPAVNYPKGSITVEGLYITGLDFTSITGEAGQWIIKPQSNDVVSVRSQLVTIPDNKINVNLIVDTVAMGDSAGGSNYKFTSSRN
jgi:hypothetical protein